MNPSCMKMCNIGIKDVVEVCEDNERSLFIAWPSRSIILTGVSTCKHRKTSGTKKVAVSKYSDCIVAASSVTVVPDQCLLQASLPELQKCLVHQTSKFIYHNTEEQWLLKLQGTREQ